MNQEIEQRTNQKLLQNDQMGQHTCIINNHQYTVLRNVFSPSIFLGTKYLTNQLIKVLKPNTKLLEIGCGVGCTLIETMLSDKSILCVGTDINPSAVENTLLNLKKYELNCKIYLGNLFEALPQVDRFNVIYWNYPFHPTNKSYQEMDILEKAVRDPGYYHLKELLRQARQYLEQDGFLLIGFSTKMGDIKQLERIVRELKYREQMISKMDESEGGICLIRIYE